jgi:sugar-phosphatase
MEILDRRFGAVLFDMDGTLIDSTAAVVATWTRWAVRIGVPAAELLADVHGRPTAHTIARFAGARDHAEEHAWIHAVALAERTSITAIPGAAGLLAHLATPWAIVTAADDALARYRLGLAGLAVPPVLVTTDRVAHGKPAPDGYLLAARSLGVAPADCVVFEDTPIGIEAARRAGSAVVALTTTFPHAQLAADAVIRDFTELRHLTRGIQR